MRKQSTRVVERGTGQRMQALAIPWQSRGFRLSLVGSVLLGLFLLATQGVGAQAALPEAVSSQGEDIRTLYFVVFGIGFAVFILVEIMIVFVAIGAAIVQSVAVYRMPDLRAMDGWMLTLFLAPGALLGGWIGAGLTHRIPSGGLRIAVNLLLTAAGLRLLLG